MAILIALAFVAQFASADMGDLRVVVTDASGAGVPSAISVQSDASQIHRAIDTDASGTATARRLPFGKYRVAVSAPGFARAEAVVEIRSAVPTEYRVSLVVASSASVDVTSREGLLDERQTGAVSRIGSQMVRQRMAALPGRALPELINTQPGWLLEAGGSVHPRGSENQTQYVVDGLPFTDNRSPGFAPAFDADALQSLGILTGGYPAEYGRKLGGVIEVATIGDPRSGFHGEASAGGGSFSTWTAGVAAGYAGGKASIAASGGLSSTDRYLDPPVEENYTNHGRLSQATVHVERGGLGVMLSRGDIRFTVPNETEQQVAGQRQVRTSGETALKVSYQRMQSRSLVFNVNGMVRDLGAALASNAASTPIFAEQQRGIRDGYAKATVAWHAGVHTWKAGIDTSVGRIDEQFAYRITDPLAFDDEIAPSFGFSDRATDREHALFIQDQMSAGPWTVKAGLRWDAYRLVVDDSAFSPRLAVAWAPTQHPRVVIRASYDRAFQTPAVENLLLASSADVDSIAPSVVRLPVRPSRGHFTEVGAAAALFSVLRLDVSAFDRRMSDFADDDLLLNTGVSFPIAFRRGFVRGAEVKLERLPGHTLSGFVTYAWMRGEAELPVSGGLFLGDEADLGTPGERVPITQDQRHTLRGRLSLHLRSGAWVALGGAFDSGLPFEDAGDAGSPNDGVPPRVLERVDLETGRVRPAATLDLSGGWTIWEWQRRTIELQADVRNITNTLRVINFAGVFSGTALAPPRAYAARVRVAF